MQQTPESFFQQMREQDAREEIPSFEAMTRRPVNYRWLYGAAAVLSLLAIMLVFFNEGPQTSEIILDTGSAPGVTDALAAPEEEDFLEWEAPTDYLSNDFND